MQRLNRGMMGRYEIPDHIPQTLRAVQFGLGEGPLGTVLRLIGGAGLDLGVACLHAGDPLGALLAEQDGLYTTFVRGYLGETHVHREEVVQAVTRVCGPEDIEALAAEPALALGILDTEAGEIDDLLDLAARLLSARRAAGPAPANRWSAARRISPAGWTRRAPSSPPWRTGWRCGQRPGRPRGCARR